MAAGEAETQWSAPTPITEQPDHWSEHYRRAVEARIVLIEKRRDLALIEPPGVQAPVVGRAVGEAAAGRAATRGSPTPRRPSPP